MQRLSAITRSPAIRVFGLAAVLTIISAWPLVRHLSSTLPSDLGDPVLETWILWWNAHTLPLSAAWWNAPMFVPMQGSMALSESLLGLAPLTTPLQWLGLSAVTAHNIAFLLSGPIAALAAYLLATRLTPRRDAAVIAALAFGFTPYRIAQLSHLQVLWACWMPFALVALHDFVSTGKTRSLVWFAACWMMNGFTNGYFLAYFPVLVGCWMLWFVRRWQFAWKIGVAAMLGSLPWLPLLLGYRVRQDAMGLSRGINEIRQFSADFSSIFAGSSRAWLSSHWTLPPGPEGELYPGAALMLIVTVGLIIAWRRASVAGDTGRSAITTRILLGLCIATGTLALIIAITGGTDLQVGPIAIKAHNPSRLFTFSLVFAVAALARSAAAARAWHARSPLAFYALAAVAMFLLALGPEPQAWKQDLFYRAPYWWLMQLPGLDSVRVPARFGLLMIVALTQVFGLAYARLFAPRMRTLVLVSMAVLVEGWIPTLPLASLPNSPHLPARAVAAGVATLELPVSSDFQPNTIALLNGLRSGQPMINGFGGYIPAHYHVLRLGLEEQDASVLGALRVRQPIAAYVEKARDTGGKARALVAAAPGAEAIGTDDAGEWFLLPELPAATPESDGERLNVQSARTGTQEDDAALILDDEPLTSWHSMARPGESDHVDLDFGQRVSVTQLEISLGPFTGDFTRDLEISAIDGDTTSTVWRGSTAGLTLTAALASKEVRVRIMIAHPISARVLRLTNVWHADRAWSIADVRAFGSIKRMP